MNISAWVISLPFMFAVANCAHLDNPGAAAQTSPLTAPPETSNDGHSSMKSFAWHDGEREHRVWMNPGLIAEFGTTPGSRLPLGQAVVRAESAPGGQTIRYWKLEQGATSERALEQIKHEQTPGRFSPVLHDSPSAEGSKRVLPGNVVVILDPSWTKEAVAEWVARRKVRLVAYLPFGPNMLMVESEPGLPALELANNLRRSGEVKAAFPDWLVEKTVK